MSKTVLDSYSCSSGKVNSSCILARGTVAQSVHQKVMGHGATIQMWVKNMPRFKVVGKIVAAPSAATDKRAAVWEDVMQKVVF